MQYLVYNWCKELIKYLGNRETETKTDPQLTTASNTAYYFCFLIVCLVPWSDSWTEVLVIATLVPAVATRALPPEKTETYYITSLWVASQNYFLNLLYTLWSSIVYVMPWGISGGNRNVALSLLWCHNQHQTLMLMILINLYQPNITGHQSIG